MPEGPYAPIRSGQTKCRRSLRNKYRASSRRRSSGATALCTRDISQSNGPRGSRLIARLVRRIVLLTWHFAARSHREAMRLGLAEIFSKEGEACELAFGAYPYCTLVQYRSVTLLIRFAAASGRAGAGTKRLEARDEIQRCGVSSPQSEQVRPQRKRASSP